MGRQFPSAEGTGPTVRRPTGRRSGPRLSALPYPLMGMRRVRNRQFGTTVRRDAPRGNAPPRLDNVRGNTMLGLNETVTAELCCRDCFAEPVIDRPKAGPVGSQ